MQIARIDNQLHKRKPGVHIHTKNKVRWENMSFEEAEKTILEIGKKTQGEVKDEN